MMLERTTVPPPHHFLTPTLANSLTLNRLFSAGDHVSLWTRHPSLGQRLMTGSSLDHFQHTNTQTLILRIKFCSSVWHPQSSPCIHLHVLSANFLQSTQTEIDASIIHLLSSPFFFFSFFSSFHLPLGIQSIVLEIDHSIGRPIRHFDIIGLG